MILIRRSKPVLVFILTLSLAKLSFAELVPEQWCSKCPPGADLTLLERDRYDCRITGTDQSAGAPSWAKPSWAKVVWDVQEGGCTDSYIRFGDEFCYRCPMDYELNVAVTDYRRSGESDRIVGKWVLEKLSFTYEGKTNHAKVGPGFWVLDLRTEHRMTLRMRGEGGKFMIHSGSWDYDLARRTLSLRPEGEKPLITEVVSMTADDLTIIESGDEGTQAMGLRRVKE